MDSAFSIPPNILLLTIVLLVFLYLLSKLWQTQLEPNIKVIGKNLRNYIHFFLTSSFRFLSMYIHLLQLALEFFQCIWSVEISSSTMFRKLFWHFTAWICKLLYLVISRILQILGLHPLASNSQKFLSIIRTIGENNSWNKMP